MKNIKMVKVSGHLMLMIPIFAWNYYGMLQKICQESHFGRWNPKSP